MLGRTDREDKLQEEVIKIELLLTILKLLATIFIVGMCTLGVVCFALPMILGTIPDAVQEWNEHRHLMAILRLLLGVFVIPGALGWFLLILVYKLLDITYRVMWME